MLLIVWPKSGFCRNLRRRNRPRKTKIKIRKDASHSCLFGQTRQIWSQKIRFNNQNVFHKILDWNFYAAERFLILKNLNFLRRNHSITREKWNFRKHFLLETDSKIWFEKKKRFEKFKKCLNKKKLKKHWWRYNGIQSTILQRN